MSRKRQLNRLPCQQGHPPSVKSSPEETMMQTANGEGFTGVNRANGETAARKTGATARPVTSNGCGVSCRYPCEEHDQVKKHSTISSIRDGAPAAWKLPPSFQQVYQRSSVSQSTSSRSNATFSSCVPFKLIFSENPGLSSVVILNPHPCSHNPSHCVRYQSASLLSALNAVVLPYTMQISLLPYRQRLTGSSLLACQIRCGYKSSLRCDLS
ncbi:hypothetical protein UC8_54650 [Roseimaritima ulvae]|uniref:Uncharacterized protein n=1 Tax=Roseimaritima ulvae TaxID=980254 RepID=A0A5B9R1X0_9BACT|nr:hypothetical protein UC8_54650 [Roseimaritima ulvae]